MPAQGYPYTPPSKTSIASILSLVFGLLGCIPVITSLAAIVTGIVGIKVTGKPGVSGRPMAVIGLLLGIIGIAIWSAVGMTALWAYRESEKALGSASTLVTALQTNDIDKAATLVGDKVDTAKLKSAAEKLQGLGTFKNFSMGERFLEVNQDSTWSLSGTAHFEPDTKVPMKLTISKLPDGSFKVTDIVIDR